jgi:hypothetical protein
LIELVVTLEREEAVNWKPEPYLLVLAAIFGRAVHFLLRFYVEPF